MTLAIWKHTINDIKTMTMLAMRVGAITTILRPAFKTTRVQFSFKHTPLLAPLTSGFIVLVIGSVKMTTRRIRAYRTINALVQGTFCMLDICLIQGFFQGRRGDKFGKVRLPFLIFQPMRFHLCNNDISLYWFYGSFFYFFNIFNIFSNINITFVPELPVRFCIEIRIH